MSTIKADDFECPKGFKKEEVTSQLYFEDLDADTELWLVRVPSDIDPSLLENLEITLDGESNFLASGKNAYELFAEACEMPNLCLVLPQKESKELTATKKTFKGTMFITESMIDVSEISVKTEPGEMELNPADESSTRAKKHKNRKDSNTNESCEQDLSSVCDPNTDKADLAASQKKHSKSHKKKKSHIKTEPSSDRDEFPNCESQK